MAYIKKRDVVNDWEQCDIVGCNQRSYYLKDEEIALCKEHGMSKLDKILSKSKKTEQDKEFIRNYVKELSKILHQMSDIFKKELGK